MRRLATACIRHRKITIGAWILALFICVFAAGAAGEEYSTNFELPDSDSARALDVLEKQFPSNSGDEVQVVLAAREGTLTDPENKAAVEQTLGEVADVEGIQGVDDPLAKGGVISQDGRVALATAQLTDPLLRRRATRRSTTCSRSATSRNRVRSRSSSAVTRSATGSRARAARPS